MRHLLMKTIFSLTFIVLLILFSSFSFKDESKNFIQIISLEINSNESVSLIKVKLGEMSEVEMCRVDLNTKSIYIIFKPGLKISIDKIEKVLNTNNFNIACYNEGIFEKNTFQILNYQDCK